MSGVLGLGVNLGLGSVFLVACARTASAPLPPKLVAPVPAQSVSARPSARAPSPSEAILAAIEAPSRSEADRVLDAGRHPRELLEFFQIAPKQKVAELAAGGGYTAELLARVVGPDGQVLGQNSPFILERFAEKPWSERLRQPWMAQVKRIDRDFDSPLPEGTHGLDAVLFILFYHDTVWLKTDRAAMNGAIYRALRPGGIYGVVDHSAREGSGLADVESLHRIEQAIVLREIEAAGFLLEAEADFLRNPGDARDWSASPRLAGEKRGTSDRFVYRFRKPSETRCAEPRPSPCSDFVAPVCGEVDTGVRCVRAPCPSTKRETFVNACRACANSAVRAYELGKCEDAQRKQ
jgi:predicted methyltransferase